jgi:hypothetical protein
MDIIMMAQEVLKAGLYLVRVVSVTPEATTFGMGLKWMFSIEQPVEAAGKKLSGFTSLTLSPKNKLARWASACLGRQMMVGETLQTEMLLTRTRHAAPGAAPYLTIERNDHGPQR